MGLWAVGHGLWVVGHGLWAVGRKFLIANFRLPIGGAGRSDAEGPATLYSQLLTS